MPQQACPVPLHPSSPHFLGAPDRRHAFPVSSPGTLQFYRDKKKHVITTQTEHKCVLDSCRWLQQRGWDVTYLPVQKDGMLDMNMLKEAMRPDTALVSVMSVNNEIGEAACGSERAQCRYGWTKVCAASKGHGLCLFH